MTPVLHRPRGAWAFVLAALAAAVAGPACGGDPAPVKPVLLNFHVVEDGRVYRSSQPSGEAITSLAASEGIRTVLNLRGPNPGEKWYDDERTACAARGIMLVDLPLSAGSLPSPDLLKSIISTLRTAQYPMLIHCQSGADRSGLVSGLYRLEVLRQDRATALRELSTDYFHFRSKYPCMDTLLEIYEPTPEWMSKYEQEYAQITCQ